MSHFNFLRAALIITLLFVLSISHQSPTFAAPNAPFIVTKTADTNDGTCNGDCSLREAITAANAAAGADIITLPAGTYTLTIAGTDEDANATGDLDITEAVTINGAGATTTIIQAGTIGYPSGSANGIDRVLHIPDAATVTLTGVTIANGKTSEDDGGGIFNKSGTLTLTDSTVSANAAFDGGGIANHFGILTLTNSTISGNSATDGGGVWSGGTFYATNSTFSGNSAGSRGAITLADAAGTVTNSTVSGNTVAVDGAGIYIAYATLNLYNTILANSTGGGDCYQLAGTVSGSHNLIETDAAGGNACGTTSPINGSDPNLAALANNGGPTQTFAMDSSSPAYNAGDNTICAAAPVSNKDQRGVTRPQDTTCDIGAYEAADALVVNTATDENDHYCFDADCSLRDALEIIAAHGRVTFDGSLAGDTLHLGSTLTLTRDVTFDAFDSITLSGDSDDNGTGDVRLFSVNPGVQVELRHLTLTKGNAPGDYGGAVSNQGILVIRDSTFTNNSALGSGAIDNINGAVDIINSTFSENTATGDRGGALYSVGVLATAQIYNSTFSGNTSALPGGAIANDSGVLTLDNTILANSTSGADCYNHLGLVGGANNLIETDSAGADACNTADVIHSDPLLFPLADNGGATHTFALHAASPAMDSGDDLKCSSGPVFGHDQRGASRPGGAHCDIGAFEADPTDDCVEKPLKPFLLKPANKQVFNKTKIKFDWTDAPCARYYQVVLKNVATGAVIKRSFPISKGKIKNLPHATYKWYAKACNPIGCVKSIGKRRFTN